MSGHIPILQMSEEQLQDMVNPLTNEDIETLKEVDTIANAAHSLMAKAEMAGVDVSAQRADLTKMQQTAKSMIAAFGGSMMDN